VLGTKTIGRTLVFGLGYLAGTRAGRDRYDQIQQVSRQLATRMREQMQAAPDHSPRSVAGAARRAWDDSDITLGRS
jgi:hypothetical protein